MPQPAPLSQLLPVAMGSQAPVKHESKLQLTGDELRLSVALIKPKIRDIGQEELKKVLKYAMVIIGLRAQNYPGELEKQLLLNFIVEHYGGHAAEEIKLAFDMAILRKLDVEANCYENFSIAYFAGIMEAYRSWAREQIKQLPAQVEQPKEFTRQEKLQLDFDYAYILLSQINKLPCIV
jgi:hypothetical protein